MCSHANEAGQELRVLLQPSHRLRLLLVLVPVIGISAYTAPFHPLQEWETNKKRKEKSYRKCI